MQPAVAPERARQDLRLLYPDMRRPRMVFVLGSRVEERSPQQPMPVLERTERGLALLADRYRALLGVGAALLATPVAGAWLAWSVLINSLHGSFQPFARGHHVPVLSLYEAVSYLVLFALIGVALWVGYSAAESMRLLGPDYRYFRDADPDLKREIAATLSTGAWPRTQALLMRASEFSEYRPVIEQEVAAATPLLESEDGPEPISGLDWRLSTAAWITLVAVILTLGAGIAGGVLRELGGSRRFELVAVGAVLVGAYVALLGVLWQVAKRRGSTFAVAFGLRRVALGRALGAAFGVALAARAFAAVWAAVVRLLGLDLPGSQMDPTTILPSGALGVAITLLVAVVLAPFAEEIVFRGVLLESLRMKWGDGVAVNVSSLVFAAMHVSPMAIPPIFVLSVILGRMYVNRRSLWPSILAHAMFNGIGVGALYVLRASGLL